MTLLVGLCWVGGGRGRVCGPDGQCIVLLCVWVVGGEGWWDVGSVGWVGWVGWVDVKNHIWWC